jgi:hypothetical protein
VLRGAYSKAINWYYGMAGCFPPIYTHELYPQWALPSFKMNHPNLSQNLRSIKRHRLESIFHAIETLFENQVIKNFSPPLGFVSVSLITLKKGGTHTIARKQNPTGLSLSQERYSR